MDRPDGPGRLQPALRPVLHHRGEFRAQRAAGSFWRPSWRIRECEFAMAGASDGVYRRHFLSEFLQPCLLWPGCLALGLRIP